VSLFRRTPADTVTSTADAPERPAHQQTKGRPTPTRKESEAARKQSLKVPSDPKEARKAARARANAERAGKRAALVSGDERNLPARDAGPVKAYVREHVDSRRSAGEFFVPIAVVVLVLGFVQNAVVANILLYVWIVMLVGIVLDTGYLWFRLRQVLPERFPNEDRRGAVPYAVMRSIQIRKLRLPKPKVKAGGAPIVPKAAKRKP
jgi:Protein of unknown function (DUF3043)